MHSTFCIAVRAQERQKRDSMYDRIENFSKKRKFGKFLYHLVFRNVPDAVVVPVTDTVSEKIFAGKHIRRIIIETYDPLGYTGEIEKRESKWFEDFGNRLHRKSRNFAVKNYLLFKEGDEYNAQKLYESERILRDTKFINRVSIRPVPQSITRDSIDISVRALDSWSLKPYGAFTGKRLGFGVSEENFLGLGHELSFYYRTDFKTKQNYKMADYRANNLFGSYFDAEIRAEKDFDHNENFYFRVNRDFISPLTKWGGGAQFDYYRHIFRFPVEGISKVDDLPLTAAKVHDQDFWAGYQFPFKKAGQKAVTDNIFASVRFQNKIFVDAPGFILDPSEFFRSYQMYLASVGYTSRKFEVKKNIFAIERPEDIPYGNLFTITGGLLRSRSENPESYIGATAGIARFLNFGYINYQIQAGTFFRDKSPYRTALRVDGTYFSPLRDFGSISARHFLSQSLVLGQNRNQSLADRINLSAASEFPEYNQYFLGKDKLILRYQLQIFIKKPWKNFQINPYVMTSLGWMSDRGTPLFSSKTQMKFGAGVLIYNPFLAFNRFQFSFVYYPKLPFDGGNAFDVNGYRNYYIPLNNFNGGRPDVVDYKPSQSY